MSRSRRGSALPLRRHLAAGYGLLYAVRHDPFPGGKALRYVPRAVDLGPHGDIAALHCIICADYQQEEAALVGADGFLSFNPTRLPAAGPVEDGGNIEWLPPPERAAATGEPSGARAGLALPAPEWLRRDPIRSSRDTTSPASGEPHR